MPDYSDHFSVLELLKKAQEIETDLRETVREVHIFLDQKDGQWDQFAQRAFAGRPRYTLDKCNDLVDDIAGAMEQSDFSINIMPAGGDATKELATTYDGLIRNIENLSNATQIYNAASRSMVRAGMDGWRVTQRWGDNNTFDQDLYIDSIPDFVNQVWFDPSSFLPTREDALYVFVLTSMSKDAYEEQFPNGSAQSVSQDSDFSRRRAPEEVVVGEVLFKEKTTIRIVEMNSGAVYLDDAKYQSIKAELEKQGVVEKRDRQREVDTVKTRLFDASDWLTDVQDTVFDMLPIVPEYSNWSVRMAVPYYWGIITKKLDAQRIYNYTQSRMVEDGAFAPLAKILATKEQIGGNQSSWERLNISADPVLPYDAVSDAPPPFKIGGADINPGLQQASQSMESNLSSTAGLDLLTGQPVGLQSGLAVDLKQQRGDTRNFKYSASKQTAICHTGKILMRAIPKVYDTKRQVRILNEDQSFDMVTINDTMVDEQTGEPVDIIDLSKGVYDVTCTVSKSFKNRQTETVSSIVEMAAIDPTIIEEGRDVLYNSMDAPGFDVLSKRVRQKMLKSGQIPEDQQSDEEKEFLAELPQPPPDPIAVALERQAEQADDKIQIDAIEAARKDRELDAKIAQDQAEQDRASLQDALNQIKLLAESLNTHADTWNKLRDAMGVETITGPGGLGAFIDQANVIRESQAEQQ